MFLNDMSAGVVGGLSLTLDVEQYNYMRSASSSAGALVMIQNVGDSPGLLKNMAYSVSAGFHTTVSLRYNKVISNSAMLEIRGTAEFHGRAYPPCHTHPRTPSRLSSLFRCGPTD